MALTPRPLPWGEGATTLYDVLEKGHRPHGSMEGWLRATRAVLIGCQVSADWHAPPRLTSRLPLAARAGQSRAFSCERPVSSGSGPGGPLPPWGPRAPIWSPAASPGSAPDHSLRAFGAAPAPGSGGHRTAGRRAALVTRARGTE